MKKKIEELFRLAMKAQEKTSAFVSFETSNHGWGCVVMIMDDGFEVKHTTIRILDISLNQHELYRHLIISGVQ